MSNDFKILTTGSFVMGNYYIIAIYNLSNNVTLKLKIINNDSWLIKATLEKKSFLTLISKILDLDCGKRHSPE